MLIIPVVVVFVVNGGARCARVRATMASAGCSAAASSCCRVMLTFRIETARNTGSWLKTGVRMQSTATRSLGTICRNVSTLSTCCLVCFSLLRRLNNEFRYFEVNTCFSKLPTVNSQCIFKVAIPNYCQHKLLWLKFLFFNMFFIYYLSIFISFYKYQIN